MAEGAARLELSERQLWRLRVAFEREGPAGLVHGNRGRPSPRRLPDADRAAILTLRRTRYADVNDTHFTELLAEREDIRLSPNFRWQSGTIEFRSSAPARGVLT